MTTGIDPHSLDNILEGWETFEDDKEYECCSLVDSLPEINQELADSKGLPEHIVLSIRTIMQKIHLIQKRPLMYFESYQDAVECVESLETTLQLLWGFPYDKNYQTYKFGFKDCTCPKTDNAEKVGTGIFVYSEGCVVHKFLFEEEDDL